MNHAAPSPRRCPGAAAPIPPAGFLRWRSPLPLCLLAAAAWLLVQACAVTSSVALVTPPAPAGAARSPVTPAPESSSAAEVIPAPESSGAAEVIPAPEPSSTAALIPASGRSGAAAPASAVESSGTAAPTSLPESSNAGLAAAPESLAQTVISPAPAGPFGTPTFPCPKELEPRVGFWVRVFAEYGKNQRVIHDARYPWVIYEVANVTGLTQSQIDARVQARKTYYTVVLERLADRSPAEYNTEEKRVAALLAGIDEGARYTRAKERIRSQPGVKEQFELGVRRSGRYLHAIHAVLDSHGLPREIACLPHVESSFHPGARSKAAAVGLWQFTSKTAKRFMKVEQDLDERLDFLCATEGAARYLAEAHDILKSWPLAVTSYNHGVGGMLRAKNHLRTEDFVRILLEYDGPSYGFASRNFYCEFLAAIEISNHVEKYFGALLPDPPLVLDAYRLPHHVKLPALARAFGISTLELADINPALGPAIRAGTRPVPLGYTLRLPAGKGGEASILYASIPANERLDRIPARPGSRSARAILSPGSPSATTSRSRPCAGSTT